MRIMSAIQVQAEVVKRLGTCQGAISMTELSEEMRPIVQSTMDIRSAVLSLILLRRVEWTPDRKVRLASQA